MYLHKSVIIYIYKFGRILRLFDINKMIISSLKYNIVLHSKKMNLIFEEFLLLNTNCT